MNILKAVNLRKIYGQGETEVRRRFTQRENRQKQEKEDIAHPVSGEFKRELETAVMDERISVSRIVEHHQSYHE